MISCEEALEITRKFSNRKGSPSSGGGPLFSVRRCTYSSDTTFLMSMSLGRTRLKMMDTTKTTATTLEEKTD